MGGWGGTHPPLGSRSGSSDCEPLPKPTLSPFALARPGTFLRVGFFTAAVWCVPALRVPLVHSLINHFRKKKNLTAAGGVCPA